MPGSAAETGRGGASFPRDSRRRSMTVRAAGSSVSMTIRLNPTPSAATMPKSLTTEIGENRFARRLTIVVTAASTSGIVTFRNPVLTASTTEVPAVRCSR